MMVYTVTVVTERHSYKFPNVASELTKTDYANKITWYILKDDDGEYIAKFRVDFVESVYYPARCTK